MNQHFLNQIYEKILENKEIKNSLNYVKKYIDSCFFFIYIICILVIIILLITLILLFTIFYLMKKLEID